MGYLHRIGCCVGVVPNDCVVDRDKRVFASFPVLNESQIVKDGEYGVVQRLIVGKVWVD